MSVFGKDDATTKTYSLRSNSEIGSEALANVDRRMDLEQDTAQPEKRSLVPSPEDGRRNGLQRVLNRVANVTRRLQTRSTDVAIPHKPVQVQPDGELLATHSRPYLWSFILVVAIPTFAALAYFLFIAADQYQSEARFTVRSLEAVPTEKTSIDSSASVPGNSLLATSSAQNAYIVTNYIRSRAIIDDIGPQLNIREIFKPSSQDPIAALNPAASIDELTSYWQRRVDTYVDPVSDIVTVQVTAFRAEDALRLNQAILNQSEKLINRISQRSRQDTVQAADIEAQQAFAQLQTSLKALQDFRNKDAVIDPGQSGTQILSLLMPLMTEQLKLKNDEAVMAAELDANAPSLRVLRNRILSLESQISNLRGQLTGSDSHTLATSLAKFEELDVGRLINERKYARAQAALDRATATARRQSIYLSVFVPPSLPEYAKFPLRVIYSLMTFVTLLIIWGIGALTYASVEDHRL
ncbi:capsule biosynthesis protein [Labrys neptuniae]